MVDLSGQQARRRRAYWCSERVSWAKKKQREKNWWVRRKRTACVGFVANVVSVDETTCMRDISTSIYKSFKKSGVFSGYLRSCDYSPIHRPLVLLGPLGQSCKAQANSRDSNSNDKSNGRLYNLFRVDLTRLFVAYAEVESVITGVVMRSWCYFSGWFVEFVWGSFELTYCAPFWIRFHTSS